MLKEKYTELSIYSENKLSALEKEAENDRKNFDTQLKKHLVALNRWNL